MLSLTHSSIMHHHCSPLLAQPHSRNPRRTWHGQARGQGVLRRPKLLPQLHQCLQHHRRGDAALPSSLVVLLRLRRLLLHVHSPLRAIHLHHPEEHVADEDGGMGVWLAS
jgi:hypothetical protein